MRGTSRTRTSLFLRDGWIKRIAPTNLARPTRSLSVLEVVLVESKYLGPAAPLYGNLCGANFPSLSYMEMRLIIGKLLWHNDVEFDGPHEAWDPDKNYPGLKVYNNWMKPGLYAKLTPRKT